MSDLTVLVPVPQWLAEDLLGIMRATRDLPGAADQIGLHLGCESGFVADVTTQLERVLAPYPLVSILPAKIRFFLPRGGTAPDDVVFMLRRVRPGRVHFQTSRSMSAIQSLPEQVFFENYQELSRAEFVAAKTRRLS